IASHRLRRAKEFDNTCRPLHGRAIETAADFDGAAPVEGLQCAELAFQPRDIAEFQDPDINLRGGLRGDHVAAPATRESTGIHRNSLLRLRKAGDAVDLTRKFEHCACARLEIDSGVRGAAFDGHGEIANALARCLQLSGEARTGLQYEHGFGYLRILFR